MEIKDNETVDLRSLFIQYLLHWKLILCTGIVGLLGAIAYVVCYPKTYETAAQILLQDDKDMFSSGSFGLGEAAGLMKSFGLSSNTGSSIVLEDELLTLTSNQLLREMVIRLGVYVDYYEPWTFKYKMYETNPLTVSCDSATLADMERSVKLEIHHKANGSTQVKAKVKFSTFNTYKQTYDLPALPAEIDVLGTKLTIAYTPGIQSEKTDFVLYADVNTPISVAETLQEDFLIEDYSKSSNVLQMSCEDYEVKRAKDMFSTLIACYNEQASDYKKELADRSLFFLNDRLENALAELAKIEAAIEVYKSKNKMTIVEFDVQMYATSMQEIQTKIIELEAQRHLVDLMDEFIHDPQNKYKLVPTLYTPSTDGTEGTSGNSLSAYNQILLERERVIKNSNIDNPMVETLSMQADRTRESVFLMINNTKKSLQMTYNDLKAKEKQLLSRMDGIPQQERVYVDLKRQQEIFQGVYLLLLQKREELVMIIGQGKERARIIDAPYVKSKPVAPRKLFAAIGLVVFTLFISMGWLTAKWLFLSIWKDLKEAYAKK